MATVDRHTRTEPSDAEERGRNARAENHELVRRFVEKVWNGENLEAIGDLSTPDLVVHQLGAGVDRDRTDFVAFHEGLLAAVPDLEHVVEAVICEGQTAVVHVSLSGTPERQYGALTPTGATFQSAGFQRYRLKEGRVAEIWVLANAMGMLQQLGVFPDSPTKMVRLMLGAVKGRILGR